MLLAAVAMTALAGCAPAAPLADGTLMRCDEAIESTTFYWLDRARRRAGGSLELWSYTSPEVTRTTELGHAAIAVRSEPHGCGRKHAIAFLAVVGGRLATVFSWVARRESAPEDCSDVRGERDDVLVERTALEARGRSRDGWAQVVIATTTRTLERRGAVVAAWTSRQRWAWDGRRYVESVTPRSASPAR